MQHIPFFSTAAHHTQWMDSGRKDTEGELGNDLPFRKLVKTQTPAQAGPISPSPAKHLYTFYSLRPRIFRPDHGHGQRNQQLKPLLHGILGKEPARPCNQEGIVSVERSQGALEIAQVCAH
jgi:hypothetical protein